MGEEHRGNMSRTDCSINPMRAIVAVFCLVMIATQGNQEVTSLSVLDDLALSGGLQTQNHVEGKEETQLNVADHLVVDNWQSSKNSEEPNNEFINIGGDKKKANTAARAVEAHAFTAYAAAAAAERNEAARAEEAAKEDEKAQKVYGIMAKAKTKATWKKAQEAKKKHWNTGTEKTGSRRRARG